MIENINDLEEVEAAVEEEFREFFKASDIDARLEGIKKTADTLDHMSSKDQYNLYKLSSHPRMFSTTNYPEMSQEFMETSEEQLRKSVKILKNIRYASKDSIGEISRHYSDVTSPSGMLKRRGQLFDNLKKHPNIEYDSEEEVYRWKE